MTDLEGVAAVVGKAGEPLGPQNPQHALAQRMLTSEVNAAVEGALAGGATEIIVDDCHGPGLSLLYDQLHPEVRIVIGKPRWRHLPALDPSFDAMFLIGYHAMAGTEGGILSHTESSVGIHNMWLNGVQVGEIAIDAACAGSLGVPVVLVTGDKAATEEAKRVLGEKVRTVAVKEGLSRNAALSLHPAKARELIRQAAEDAVRHIHEVQPLVFEPPYRMRTEYKLESSADAAMSTHAGNVTRVDSRTIEVVSDSMFGVI
jgi:D-amino peptidase